MSGKRLTQPIRPATSPATIERGRRTETSTARDWYKTLTLIEIAAQGRHRLASVEAIGEFIAQQFPGSRVRCGVGMVRMHRLYDARLGWLNSLSELYRAAAASWNEEGQAEVSPTETRDSAAVESSAETTSEPLRIDIDDEHGFGRCVIWIEGEQLDDFDRMWIRRAVPSLRSILWYRGGGALGRVARNLSGSGMTSRVYLGTACLTILLFAMLPVSYRVRCSSVIRPDHSRVIAAPFDATLQTTHVEPGDRVQVGTALFELDGHPLRLELESVEAQIGQAEKEQNIAMAAGRVADAQQATLRIREFGRQRDLLLGRLERLHVVSPIDGIVVAGELNRSIGAPLKTGQAVMEVAPLDRMVIEIEIPEHEIRQVKKGTVARVRPSAGGGPSLELSINSIYPAAEVRNDQNVFIGRINVANPGQTLRPGMRGDAIAYGPVRPWLWSLLRSGVERVLWWVGY